MVREKTIWCNEEQKVVKAVHKEDYLKVVEENDEMKDNEKRGMHRFNRMCEQLKDKDEEIKRLKRANEINSKQKSYWENSSIHNYRIGNELQKELEKAKDTNVELAFKNKELKDHIDVLTELLKDKEEKPKEKLWVLEYVYSDDLGLIKNIKLDPQPKEELFELIGMDSDNWFAFTMREVE